MVIQVQHLGSRLLLILALAAALLAGLVAVQLATGHNSISQTAITKLGGDAGGGKHRETKLGGDAGGGHLRETKVGGDQGGGH